MSPTDWKSKSNKYALENKRLKKRLKETTKSRDDWKKKSMGHKKRADHFAADLKKLKNKLNELIDIQ
jgi:regulator of replication initiation timing